MRFIVPVSVRVPATQIVRLQACPWPARGAMGPTQGQALGHPLSKGRARQKFLCKGRVKGLPSQQSGEAELPLKGSGEVERFP